jgi:hypothetical protein
MYKVLQDTNQHFKKKPKKSFPDNFVFCLHYKMTFWMLMLCSILVSSYGYFSTDDTNDRDGAAIQCMLDKDAGVTKEMVNTFCWFSSTYTLPRYWEGREGVDFLSYGVGAYSLEDEKVHHAYYQWVPLILALQAVMFYLPHFIWKMMEGGRMEQIIDDLYEELPDTRKQRLLT